MRRRLYPVTLGAIVMVLGVAFAPSAWATNYAALTGSYDPGCSRAWNYNPYGADVQGSYYAEGTVSNSTIHLTDGQSTVNGMVDCGPGGYAVNANITLTTQFTMYGTSLSGCTAGFPASFSCTESSTSETTKYTVYCPNNHYCSHTFGNLNWYSGPGGNYNSWYELTVVTLTRSDGIGYSFQTTRSGKTGF